MTGARWPAPEETIDCVDCGGRCHLTSTWPDDDPPQPGDILVYRCEECLDRWDLVYLEEEEEPPGRGL